MAPTEAVSTRGCPRAVPWPRSALWPAPARSRRAAGRTRGPAALEPARTGLRQRRGGVLAPAPLCWPGEAGGRGRARSSRPRADRCDVWPRPGCGTRRWDSAAARLRGGAAGTTPRSQPWPAAREGPGEGFSEAEGGGDHASRSSRASSRLACFPSARRSPLPVQVYTAESVRAEASKEPPRENRILKQETIHCNPRSLSLLPQSTVGLPVSALPDMLPCPLHRPDRLLYCVYASSKEEQYITRYLMI